MFTWMWKKITNEIIYKTINNKATVLRSTKQIKKTKTSKKDNEECCLKCRMKQHWVPYLLYYRASCGSTKSQLRGKKIGDQFCWFWRSNWCNSLGFWIFFIDPNGNIDHLIGSHMFNNIDSMSWYFLLIYKVSLKHAIFIFLKV